MDALQPLAYHYIQCSEIYYTVCGGATGMYLVLSTLRNEILHTDILTPYNSFLLTLLTLWFSHCGYNHTNTSCKPF